MKEHTFPNANIATDYKYWALARRGTANPENMTNSVWTWMLRDKVGPYRANQMLDKDHQYHPAWSYYRYGQSETVLPDGRKILIGGEHEDWYDEDFFIYNDVILFHPDGEITCYGYKEYFFPPTDQHSATLVGDRIYIIGCLGYPYQRKNDTTPIYCLELKDFRIWEVRTEGFKPRWLHEHSAVLSECGRFIVCEGGKVWHKSGQWVDNHASWQFELETKRWSKIFEKPWRRWTLTREEFGKNEIELIQFLNSADPNDYEGKPRAYLEQLLKEGRAIDPVLCKSRFNPPTDYTAIGADPDKRRSYRVLIDGTILIISESDYEINFILQGELSPKTVARLQIHYRDVYAKIEGVAYLVESID